MNVEPDSKLQADSGRSLEVNDGVDAWHLAKTAINLAQELEATETRIKEEVLKAAKADDLSRVLDLVTRWLKGPVCDVLASGAKAPSGANCPTDNRQRPQTGNVPS